MPTNRKHSRLPPDRSSSPAIPKRMSFLVQGSGPLEFLDFLSILSFAKLHASRGWKITAYRCPSYRRPPCRLNAAVEVSREHVPPGGFPTIYAGRDYWPDLLALGVQMIDCSEASEAADLKMLANLGGFWSPTSVLWVNPLDSLYDIVHGFGFAMCHEKCPPQEGDESLAMFAGPPRSPWFLESLLFLIGQRNDQVFGSPGDGVKKAVLPPHTFSPWPAYGDFYKIFNEVHELPKNGFAVNWRHTGPLTELMRRLLVDRAAVERLGDCTFKRLALRMLAV